MKFIVSMGIRNLPDSLQPMHEIYRDFLEEAVLAEELGFNAVWASEHHFSPDAWSPSPVPFLAAVAARTRRIRIGTYVLLLPLHNPVRIAEDFAVLDNISRGREHLARARRSAGRGRVGDRGIPHLRGAIRRAPRPHVRRADRRRALLYRRKNLAIRANITTSPMCT